MNSFHRNIAIDMGTTKTNLFTEEQNELASYAKVLGHPARIAILQHLVSVDNCICGDLVDELGLAQSTISQHLKELKTSGIIQGNIDGTSICYCLNPEKWSEIKVKLNKLFTQCESNEINCC